MWTSEEEDVGDHMIHRRQEHSEYYRATVTWAEPFWRVHRFSTRGARSGLTKTLVLIELWHVDRALKHNIMQYVLDLSLHINGGSRCFHKMDSCVEDQNMQSEQCDPVSQLHSSFSSAVQTALYNAATIGRQLCVCVWWAGMPLWSAATVAMLPRRSESEDVRCVEVCTHWDWNTLTSCERRRCECVGVSLNRRTLNLKHVQLSC